MDQEIMSSTLLEEKNFVLQYSSPLPVNVIGDKKKKIPRRQNKKADSLYTRMFPL